MRSWVLLALGILLEVAGTLCMKASNGFGHWQLAVWMYVFYALSLTALTLAFRDLEVSIGYAVWSGAGLVLVVAVGILWFDEPASPASLLLIAFVFVGLVGLHVSSQFL